MKNFNVVDPFHHCPRCLTSFRQLHPPPYCYQCLLRYPAVKGLITSFGKLALGSTHWKCASKRTITHFDEDFEIKK